MSVTAISSKHNLHSQILTFIFNKDVVTRDEIAIQFRDKNDAVVNKAIKKLIDNEDIFCTGNEYSRTRDVEKCRRLRAINNLTSQYLLDHPDSTRSEARRYAFDYLDRS
jgi:hypothetical protein